MQGRSRLFMPTAIRLALFRSSGWNTWHSGLVSMLQRQRLLSPSPHTMLRIVFAAVDRTHEERSVTRSHPAVVLIPMRSGPVSHGRTHSRADRAVLPLPPYHSSPESQVRN